MSPPTAIIGLGNLYMSDDGIGVRVVHALAGKPNWPRDIEILDLGAGGIQVIHDMVGRERVIFVDCALMNREPGAIECFVPEEVVSRKITTRCSSHEGDLMEMIELARRLGTCPKEVVIFGIQPASTAMGAGLSPELRRRLPEYVEAVAQEALHARVCHR